QEQVVTERNGRYVLVVKTEHRGSIPGIVHGSSGSGASLFLEPLSTVEINNDIVALEEQEREEVRRILLALTDLFRARAPDRRREDGRTQDRRPVGVDGTGGPVDSRRRRVPVARVPIGVRRHRGRSIHRGKPEYVLIARDQHRRDGPPSRRPGARAARRDRFG